LAPCAHIDVRFTDPVLRWSGIAYLDANAGTEPLEKAFHDWTWSRASLRDSAVVLYDVNPRDAAARTLALRFGPDGAAERLDSPPTIRLPGTGWRLPRYTRVDAGHSASVRKTLEDAPFYSRSLLSTHVAGRSAPAIHESLDLDRFKAPWVQCMLPFRMPKRFSTTR